MAKLKLTRKKLPDDAAIQFYNFLYAVGSKKLENLSVKKVKDYAQDCGIEIPYEERVPFKLLNKCMSNVKQQ